VVDLNAVLPLFFSLGNTGDTEIESKILTHALKKNIEKTIQRSKTARNKNTPPSPKKNRKGKIKLTSTLFHRSLPGSQLKNATPLSRSITTSSQFRILSLKRIS
jgi:hypothetical protein